MAALEKKVQRMDSMEEELRRLRGLEDEVQELRDAEADNQRLRESNEQLRQEIDRRDQAITEAVGMICLLESKVAQLQTGADTSRPSTARAYEDDDPGATTPRQATIIDIPERTSSKRGTMVPKHRRTSSESRCLQRAPSFLSDETKSTTALPDASSTDDQSRSAFSEITKSESFQSMSEFQEPESPRLSALSECSELYPPDDPTDDQLEIPVKRDSIDAREPAEVTVEEAVDQSRIESWIQPHRDTFLDDVPKQNIIPANLLKKTDNPSFETDSCNGSSLRTRVDSVFGSTRLPPTPDTMSTAYATGPNRSNGSIVAEKSFVDQALPMKNGLGRPRSASALTTRRSSGNSAAVDSVEMNVSDVTLPRLTDEGDESPAIFPLNSITSRDGGVYCPEPLDKMSLGYYDQDAFLDGEGLGRVLSKLDNNNNNNNYYGPARRPGSMPEDSESSLSSSPPLTPQDWIEAAKSDSHRRREPSGLVHTAPKPSNPRPLGARISSQSSFLGRRHSMDSHVRDSDVPMIPTLDLQSLDSGSQPEPDLDRRMIGRRISLRPPFFARSAPPRRLQPSLMSDPTDSDDGAPAPIVRKARDEAPSKPTKTSKAEPRGSSFSVSAPIHTIAKVDDIHRTLPHSFTESFMSSAMSRPPTSGSKEHKRRSSLGIFGWMKGASGLGKKHEPESPAKSSMASNALVRSKANRLADARDYSEPPRTIDMGAMNLAIDDFSLKSRHAVRDDDELGRRPRYMDRRSRRG